MGYPLLSARLRGQGVFWYTSPGRMDWEKLSNRIPEARIFVLVPLCQLSLKLLPKPGALTFSSVNRIQ